MIHILRIPSAPDLEFPDDPTTTQWQDHAVAYYQFYYTYYDKDEDEQEWLDCTSDWLDETLPDEYEGKVVLLAPGAAFMGEDIYVVDGHLQHTIHRSCSTCGSHTMLSRKGGPLSTSEETWEGATQMWCATCNDYRELTPWKIDMNYGDEE